jgi:carbonic anhydrase
VDDILADHARRLPGGPPAPGPGPGRLLGRPAPPERQLAVVTCMDARFDPVALLGLQLGQAHVLRNAGGIVTDDVRRSLLLSQQLLGTRDVTLIHHSGCGIQDLDEPAVTARLQKELGVRLPFRLGSFSDPAADVRASAEALRRTPYLVTRRIEGYVYDVDTGQLAPVDLAPPG